MCFYGACWHTRVSVRIMYVCECVCSIVQDVVVVHVVRFFCH